MYRKRNGELEVVSLYTGNYKGRFYLREISKLTKLPLRTVQNILLELEKSKVLKSKVEGKNKYFSLNIDNIKTKSYLLRAEIQKSDLFLDTYPQFKTFMKSLSTDATVIVFGSFSKFSAGKESDLDMLTISEKEQKLPFHLLPHKVHRIDMEKKSFLKAVKEQETLVKEIEENHIILNNHSFYVNRMWDHHGE